MLSLSLSPYYDSDSLLLTQDGQSTEHNTQTEPGQGECLRTVESGMRAGHSIYNMIKKNWRLTYKWDIVWIYNNINMIVNQTTYALLDILGNTSVFKLQK